MKISKISYRPEIHGLRAVAVLLVLFYHVRFAWMPGGFIGVDIFFVISGYLINSILISEVQNGTFAFGAFYGRRVRRLGPSLLATVVATIIGGAFVFSTTDFARLGEEVFSVLLGVSNFYYAGKGGYFDAASSLRPLLHTWSLAVEEQIYLFGPLIVWFTLTRWSLRMLLIVTAATALLSLVASEIWLDQDSSAVYYLMPFRIFEFSMGALLLWLPSLNKNRAWMGDGLLLAGLAIILISAISYTDATRFPGLAALLPVTGSAMVIYASSAGHAKRLLDNRAMVAIGLMSYSVYLVHWPMVVYLDYYRALNAPEFYDPYVIVVLSLVLGAVFYRLFERPFRKSRGDKTKLGPAGFGLVCAGVAMLIMTLSASIWASGGWAWRVPNSQPRLVEGYGPCRKDDACIIGAPEGQTVLLVGDSHAKHLIYGLDLWGRQNNVRIAAFTAPACNVTPLVYKASNRVRGMCGTLKAKIAKSLKANPDAPIILAERWRGYPGRMKVENAIVAFIKANKDRNIVLVGQMPQPDKRVYLCGYLPAYLLADGFCQSSTTDRIASGYAIRWQNVAGRFSSVVLGDVDAALCGDGACKVRINGQNIYSDQHHLSGPGSWLIAKQAIGPELIKLLKR